MNYRAKQFSINSYAFRADGTDREGQIRQLQYKSEDNSNDLLLKSDKLDKTISSKFCNNLHQVMYDDGKEILKKKYKMSERKKLNLKHGRTRSNNEIYASPLKQITSKSHLPWPYIRCPKKGSFSLR